ncbi:MAG: slipin family protein [Leptospiraceae bacterium]|nr:slipin family protein [Leptospiraceae bacterium]
MFIIIQEDEIGLKFRNGKFITILKKGRNFYSDFLGDKVIVYKIQDQFQPNINLDILLENSELKNSLEIVQVAEEEICLVIVNDVLQEVLKTGRYAYWKSSIKRNFQKVSTKNIEVDSNFNTQYFTSPKLVGYFTVHQIESYQTGLLIIGGEFQRELKSGRYFFWYNQQKPVIVYTADHRVRDLEVVGQEIMTSDRVTLRINCTCQYQVTNARKTILEIVNSHTSLHLALQLALRDYVGKEKLDNLLEKKDEIAKSVLASLQEREEELGVKFINSGIKDIILPGEIKDILNTVLLAEKKAQANIITRREEIASTRSLLNTAKLLDENKTLYRLKELEYIEKIVEKVGSIHLNSAGGILEQLSNLVKDKSIEKK